MADNIKQQIEVDKARIQELLAKVLANANNLKFDGLEEINKEINSLIEKYKAKK